jgi:hypothetical protein
VVEHSAFSNKSDVIDLGLWWCRRGVRNFEYTDLADRVGGLVFETDVQPEVGKDIHWSGARWWSQGNFAIILNMPWVGSPNEGKRVPRCRVPSRGSTNIET